METGAGRSTSRTPGTRPLNIWRSLAVCECAELVGIDHFLVLAALLGSFGTLVRVHALPAGEIDWSHAAFGKQTVDRLGVAVGRETCVLLVLCEVFEHGRHDHQ